ncbi:SAR2788 family putative toxin [Mesobacillus foraminis]|uniref:SAR2788 family putative toxin n=1 Tax=Mesobacillus foraminis TaxID=279826 RepID=UPI001BEAAE8A|nr:SAR2788 family putative toxin [Mesobacillus foraminis]MBT2755738.1 SAR2788 family putative toxin [Mesobacillus foraminis]
MKKIYFSFIATILIFACIAPAYARAATEEEQYNQLEESIPAITDIQEEEVTTVDIESAEEETNEFVGEDIEDSLEIQSEVVDDTAVIETEIESEDVHIDSTLELDLESSAMTVETELEIEDGQKVSKSFDVSVTEVNGEDFTAKLTDTETGEIYEVNTEEVSASWYPLVVIAIHVARYGITYAIKKYGKSAVTKATSKYGKKATANTLKKVQFASKSTFDRHWRDHKNEFPGYTQSKYLTRAQAIAGTTGKHILTKKRANGDILKYNKDTNELLILDKNDVIRTLFKPKHPNKSKGYEYFKRQ